jgi:hypothetical protein
MTEMVAMSMMMVMMVAMAAAPEEEAALERGATPAQTQEALREADRVRRFFWNRCRTRCFTSVVADCGQEKGETGGESYATIWWRGFLVRQGVGKHVFRLVYLISLCFRWPVVDFRRFAMI